MYNCIIEGDCLDILPTLEPNSINLIITSPPYANQRKDSYGGIEVSEYVNTFLPISAELYRVLKSDGSFILNIKENVVKGERSTYVIELILALRKQGWLWTEEYIWHKTCSTPGKWPNRFRDAWERCLHFTKERKFAMYQDAVKVPIGDWATKRLTNLGKNDSIRLNSKTGSKFGKNVSNWAGKDTVYPDNVLYLPTETGNKGHGAVFPLSLPTWFIKLFTQEGDVVLDPFLGSGTTAVACIKENREYIGIEILHENILLANSRISQLKT
jgi:site-specific DNA-methyltransferase (adenine-specific)